GYKHARTVRDSLRAVAASVRVVEALDGKDARDHLARGHAPEAFAVLDDAELDRLAGAGVAADDAEPLFTDDGTDLAEMCVDWKTFWARDHCEEQWFAWPLLAKGRGHALYAPAKAGKSSVLLYVAAAIATGRPLFGRPVQPARRVLYVDYEMTG